MSGFSVPKPKYPGQWLTTVDLARTLERTDRGARWIAEQHGLWYQRTMSGVRLYREVDVQRLAKQRADARLRGVKVLRPKKVGVRGEPRQLSLFAPRLVRRGENG